jgi:hypothetical protein
MVDRSISVRTYDLVVMRDGERRGVHALPTYLAVDHQVGDDWLILMLERVDARGQRQCCIVGYDGNVDAEESRPPVKLFGHEVHADRRVCEVAGVVCLDDRPMDIVSVHAYAAKVGQRAGVDVEDGPCIKVRCRIEPSDELEPP